ncbi:hypothetical protein [Litorihabitans aurantiacus]|uniref:Uncharacterized protein n=1 Tax=Litorihabitans aurantiacus TaxID=1930061 RepID=A0AA37XH84_9MICO|nr:hypothetical protein [Litorihabitans aurantiacus]GMA33526.1 hypothetical protein GCM10025875_35180 [Litorihabitans aurantiacus]GMA33621.1 hypothetical protein GCM10025875_36130 [Litorihabitans aurantiacus]
MNTALARNSDPTTSHLAGDKVDVTTHRGQVLAILTQGGALTHEELVAAHQRRQREHGWKPASPQSIRSRCSELERAGEVERVADRLGRSSMGNAAHYWKAVAR